MMAPSSLFLLSLVEACAPATWNESLMSIFGELQRRNVLRAAANQLV
jgi:hypothetical protein